MSPAFAFVAGLVTVLSPCLLPLLPVILANGALGGRLRPIGLIIGFTGCFTAVTLLLSLLVRNLAISPDIHRIAAASIFVLMGLVLTLPVLKRRFELLLSPVVGNFALPSGSYDGFGGGFVSGAGLGLAWTPCVGPIMASVITLALNQQSTALSALTALAFSLGTALPMAAFIIFGNRIFARIGFLKRHSTIIQQLMGIFILLVGLAIWLGLDRAVQVALFRAFPGWEPALTGWEHSVVD